MGFGRCQLTFPALAFGLISPPLDILVMVLVIQVHILPSDNACEMRSRKGERLVRKHVFQVEVTLVVPAKFSNGRLPMLLSAVTQSVPVSR